MHLAWRDPTNIDTEGTTMRIVTGFVRSAEGRAAFHRAVEEARLRDAELVLVHTTKGGPLYDLPEVREYRDELEEAERQLQDAGIVHRRREFAAQDSDPAKDLLRVAREEDADLIVIGIRRRSPVGKLVLGSTAQDVLLQADCAVLAVKPSGDL